MPIIYRTAGAWGVGKGGNLTPAEVDGNFHDIVQQLASLELGPTPAEIENIVVAGDQMTIILDDARTFGPFALPVAAFRWRGVWVAASPYSEFDTFEVPGVGIFMSLVEHTTAATFDPDFVVGGSPAYQQFYAEPRSAVVEVSGSTFTPSLVWAYYRFNNVAGCAVTIPDSSALPVGTEFHFRQSNEGAVTFAGAAGVTLNLVSGTSAATARMGGVVTAKKVSATAWDLFGLLAEVEA